MSNKTVAIKDYQVIPQQKEQTSKTTSFLHAVKSLIWFVGIPAWLFAICDRALAIFTKGHLSVLEFVQILTIVFFFVTWLYLKPEPSSESADEDKQNHQLDIDAERLEVYKGIVANRMLQLQEQHAISQEYTLSFPYLCQIYHLLNLKHLETIHSFSLNNLKIVGVSQFESTHNGGKIRFQTVLDSPFNVLRIWRQPLVDVNLTLLTPYTVELSIPVYNGKHIIVLFNAVPLNQGAHKFFIDIYTELEWPKPLLQFPLHIAAIVTLFEDLPYLRKLAQRNIDRLFKSHKGSDCNTLWLYKRFVDLYGSSELSAQLPPSSAQ
ncbi:hypothetical protein Ple7327_4427 [Pleurocapsa sp. PCC 7327]|uniref:hypothetical protein n=1 Tax=Pleurocapsa sp. PCC 7327 TaxID=118163 RepID=UPI00029FA0CD|nr:hypothetical protein [Pleurocapsa sp. PCC 7327]AFY79533.1 hypothetical protein Ple7327_4427 [Pleurocapsa sp. PCC 7327]